MASEWPGLGERIGQRLVELGWRRPNGKPDIMRFSMERRYVHTFVYKWLSGTSPSRENLERLAKDLQVHPAWLLFGDEVQPLLRKSKRVMAGLLLALLGTGLWGVHADAHATPAKFNVTMPLIGRFLRRLWGVFVNLPPSRWSGIPPIDGIAVVA